MLLLLIVKPILRSLKECILYGIQRNVFPKIPMFDDSSLSVSYPTWQRDFANMVQLRI